MNAGETADAGTVKFKAEDGDDNRTMAIIFIALAVIIVAIAVSRFMGKNGRKAGE